MKLKSILAALVLLSALAASDARADMWCSLNVNPWSYIVIGQSFSYTINIAGQPWPGPYPPGGHPGPPFSVVFYGSKNGVDDIPLSGEAVPGTFGYGSSELTGYQNPSSGGFGGTYLRYAKIYDNFPGHVYCVTNTVAVVLQ